MKVFELKIDSKVLLEEAELGDFDEEDYVERAMDKAGWDPAIVSERCLVERASRILAWFLHQLEDKVKAYRLTITYDVEMDKFFITIDEVI
jgi:hypothetical protein